MMNYLLRSKDTSEAAMNVLKTRIKHEMKTLRKKSQASVFQSSKEGLKSFNWGMLRLALEQSAPILWTILSLLVAQSSDSVPNAPLVCLCFYGTETPLQRPTLCSACHFSRAVWEWFFKGCVLKLCLLKVLSIMHYACYRCTIAYSHL